MFRKLTTTPVQNTAQTKTFFDNCAVAYSEQHGHPQRLLNYRIGLIREYARPCRDDVVLDIGCGNGHHLFALAEEIVQGIGVDLSSSMIEVAQAHLRNSPLQGKLTFLVDNGEEIGTIPEHSVDLVICIGALEHMPDKAAVMTNVYRLLKPRGRFFCLTPHGGYLWYQAIAPLLGMDTKHLSTDKFLKRHELVELLEESGFLHVRVGYWTFIPKGDMPSFLAFVLAGLDKIGKLFRANSLRGGLSVCAWKDKHEGFSQGLMK
jgi:2-polyprenyl-3-methyl-5-hydroxy-6-metoxy-1,4-benzoquinol methylase